MPNLKNNTVRPIRIGNTLLVPGMSGEVANEHMTNVRVKQLMEGGSLSNEEVKHKSFTPSQKNPEERRVPEEKEVKQEQRPAQPENRAQPQQANVEQSQNKPAPVDQKKQEEVRK
jgi:hypothetical protein